MTLARMDSNSPRCSNEETCLERLQAYDLLRAAESCGVPPERIEEAAIIDGVAVALGLVDKKTAP